MIKLLEIKDRLVGFYSKYDTFLFPIVKFAVAFFMFYVINTNIGFMHQISSVPVAVVLGIVGAVMPFNITILLAGVVILLDMYALAMEAAVVTLVLFLLIYFAYFRFAPQDGMAVILTPVCLKFNIPYIMPLGVGLLREAYSVLAVLCSTLVYYYLDGIRQNEAAFAAVATDTDGEVSSKFSIAIGQITSNREMFLVMIVFLIATLVVYLVRRSSAEHAWTIAIVSGSLIQVVGLIVGYITFHITQKTAMLLIGSAISFMLALLIQFFCMNLDYARTERVQFEDDEYYYYVKAVPKKMVATEEKVVKHFGNTASMGKMIERSNSTNPQEDDIVERVIAKELELNEDLLK